MWMEFWVWRAVCSGTATSASTPFPSCVWLPQGFIEHANFWQAFFEFFLTGIQHLGSQNSGRMECRNALSMRVEGDNLVTIPCLQMGRWHYK